MAGSGSNKCLCQRIDRAGMLTEDAIDRERKANTPKAMTKHFVWLLTWRFLQDWLRKKLEI